MPNRCVWCGVKHEGKYMLCDAHEEMARNMRAKRGLDIQVIFPVTHSEAQP